MSAQRERGALEGLRTKCPGIQYSDYRPRGVYSQLINGKREMTVPLQDGGQLQDTGLNADGSGLSPEDR